MANRKIGAVIALDGEQQFKSAVTACTRELNTMKSALKLVETQTSGQAKSLATLRDKHTALNNVLEATKKKETEVSTALQHAKTDRERVKDETEKYRKKLTEAEKALEEMKKSGEATDTELEAQEKIVKSLANTVESGEKAYEKAGTRVQEWEKKLYDAKTETTKAQKAVDEIEDEMRELETATDKAADQLDDYGDEAKDAAKNTDDLDISLKSMIKNSAVNLAVDAMRSIGDKAIEAAKYVVDVGSTFETSMSKVEAISGATGGDLAKLTEKAKEMGSTTKFSASESAQAFEYMAMAGWKTNDMLEGIDGVMALAAASGADLATTSDIVTDALTAFGQPASEAGRLADIMAAASSNANTNVGMMGETFKYAAPVAGALGVSMKDTAIAVGLMANSGIKASQAGTSLRTGLTNLAKPTKQMQDAMDKYNVALVKNDDGSVNLRKTMIQLRDKIGGLTESEKAAATAAIFGKNSMAGWLAIINASDEDFDTLTSAIDNSEGAAQGMANTMQNNLSGAMTIFKSALEGLGIELYDKAVKPLTGAVEFATGVISGLTKLIGGGGSARDYLDDFYKSVKSANDEVERTLESAKKTVDNAKAKVGLLTGFETEFINIIGRCGDFSTALDDLGGRKQQVGYIKTAFDETTGAIRETYVITDEFTKSKITTMVGELGDSVSGLKDAWNEETGELSASRTELENWFGVAKEVATFNALQEAIGEVANAYGMAVYNQKMATSGYNAAKTALDEFIVSTGKSIEELEAEANQFDSLGGPVSQTGQKYRELSQNVLDAEANLKTNNEQLAEAESQYTSMQGAIDETAAELENLGFWTHEEAEEAKDAADAIGDETDATEDANDAIGDYIDGKVKSIQSTVDNTDAVDEETTSVKNSGEAWAEKRKAQQAARKETDKDIASGKSMAETAQDEADALEEAITAIHANATAMGELRDAYAEGVDHVKGKFEEYKTAAESAFDINPFETWKVDTQKGVQELIESFNTQAMAFAAYRDNLNVVKENMGEISPEFVQYLQNMGESGYYVVEQLAEAFRNGDTAKAEELMNAYIYVTDIQDDLTNNMAINQMALSDGLSKLSPEAIKGWDDLGLAFDEGNEVVKAKGGTINGTLVDQFWSLINTSKEMGLEVPKGAAESIRNSDDPERAIAETSARMITRLQGEGAEWIRIADANGIAVDASIRDAIVNGTGDVENAVRTVKNSVLNVKPEFARAGTEAGEAAGEGTATGITNEERAVTDAADGVLVAAKNSASKATSEFRGLGEEASGETATGITNKKGDVSGSAEEVVKSAKESASTATDTFKIVGHTAMEALKGGIREKSQDLGSAVNAALSIAKNQATNHGNQIFPGIGSDIVAHITSGINNNGGNAINALNGVLDAMNNNAGTRLGALTRAFQDAMSTISWTVSNTQLNFPSIRIPHVNWRWEELRYGDGGVTYYPSFWVDWYAKAMENGMILDNPTIFGMMDGKLLGAGEAGSETVVGTSSLMDMIETAVDDGLTNYGKSSGGTDSRLDALLDVVEAYLPQILEAAEANKEVVIGDRAMGMIANKTSETIGRNARRLM